MVEDLCFEVNHFCRCPRCQLAPWAPERARVLTGVRHWRMIRPVVIVEAKAFTARVGDLLEEDEYRLLQLELVQRPTAGRVIPGTGGLRKLRWALGGRGKRGGARVIYFWHAESERILMLFVYPKNEREDLAATQRKALKAIVEAEYP